MGIAVGNSVYLIEEQIKKAEEIITNAESELQSLSVCMNETLTNMGHSLMGILKAAETIGSDQKQAAQIYQEMHDELTRLSALVATLDSILCKFLIKETGRGSEYSQLDPYTADEEQTKKELAQSSESKASNQKKTDQPNLVAQCQKDFDLLMHMLEQIAGSQSSSQSQKKKDHVDNDAGQLSLKEIPGHHSLYQQAV